MTSKQITELLKLSLRMNRQLLESAHPELVPEMEEFILGTEKLVEEYEKKQNYWENQ